MHKHQRHTVPVHAVGAKTDHRQRPLATGNALRDHYPGCKREPMPQPLRPNPHAQQLRTRRTVPVPATFRPEADREWWSLADHDAVGAAPTPSGHSGPAPTVGDCAGGGACTSAPPSSGTPSPSGHSGPGPTAGHCVSGKASAGGRPCPTTKPSGAQPSPSGHSGPAPTADVCAGGGACPSALRRRVARRARAGIPVLGLRLVTACPVRRVQVVGRVRPRSRLVLSRVRVATLVLRLRAVVVRGMPLVDRVRLWSCLARGRVQATTTRRQGWCRAVRQVRGGFRRSWGSSAGHGGLRCRSCLPCRRLGLLCCRRSMRKRGRWSRLVRVG